MKVLLTGNLGYVGSVLTDLLLSKGHNVTGYDVGYYEDCTLYKCDSEIKQIKKDIRKIEKEDIEGVDAIIHIAALSNDPLGEFNVGLTEDINFNGTMRVAQLAKELGIKRFVYASSQSMYGIAKLDKDVEEDDSEKNPLTAYARTKWEAELELKKMATPEFTVVALRPSTVFGSSPRLRCDIVFNNLVSCAYTTNKIEIKSDGTPWRPAIHTIDVSRAFIAALEAPKDKVANQAFNVGNGNFTVKELAEIAQESVSGSELVFTGEAGNDERTYKVSFKKIADTLGDYYAPEWDLKRGADDLINNFKANNFTEEDFRGRKFTRLKQIKHLMENNKINDKLYFT